MASYDQQRIDWCYHYMNTLREIEFEKFDLISANMLENIEKYTEFSDEELKKREKEKSSSKQQDSNTRPFFSICNPMKDIKIGMFGKCVTKQNAKFLEFEIGATCVLPRTHQSSQVIIKGAWTAFNWITKNKYYPDLAVGGIVDLKFYAFPEQYKEQKYWKIRNIYGVQDRLQYLPFPEPNSQSGESMNLQYTLPQSVWISENPEIRVALWDEATESFSSEQIDKLMFDKQARTLTFHTVKLAPFAFLQTRITDYPYKSWDLRCVENDVAMVTVETQRTTFTFEVGVNYACLINRDDPELQHIVGNKWEPGYLLLELQKCGINLLPIDDDAALAKMGLKERAAEERAITDIVTTMRSVAFRSSKWNKEAGDERVFCKLRENLEFDREFLEDHE